MNGFKDIVILSAVLFLSFISVQAKSQLIIGRYDTIRVEVTITDEGEKVPTGELDPLFLYARANAKMRKMYEAWTRLRNAVYVTYPYAKTASRVINEINRELVGVTNRKKRKAIIKSHEKELRTQFTSKIKNLSVYQGKVLMKLICRETGSSCYEILDEYKGDFNAFVYQGVAKLFGSSLKQTYDPNGEDRSIEILVQQAQAYYRF
ncbi:hypothetical protein A9P82_07600 [Arachidicoccus ginsenosidimutans]|uniref:DUF4294 domain-containing protein n=1 Tax=Arachidicoccus sp. BS20 TaxID=1850526 RepID=UPI0007F0AB83|nr:DUF4294 domain-containing protein [Arachidicoccus sp. BS20]ANI89166.1 hypothetical protein A9P82_07600 [Arachidicoccus sp. BS20]